VVLDGVVALHSLLLQDFFAEVQRHSFAAAMLVRWHVGEHFADFSVSGYVCWQTHVMYYGFFHRFHVLIFEKEEEKGRYIVCCK
jgi:hypothetical protein